MALAETEGFRPIKLLITGAEGVLGSALVRVAKEMEHSVTGLDRVALDITDAGRTMATIAEARPDAVINCAAFSNVDAAQEFPEEALKVNRDGAQNVAAAAEEVGARMVYIGTDYVFDGKQTTPYLPTDQPSPLNLYGISKLAGEQAVREVALQALILRTSWIFGEGGSGFVAWARKALSESGGPLHIVEDERSRPTWSRDLAQGILDLVEAGATGRHHLANAGDCTRLELAEEIRAILGSERELVGVRSEAFGAPARRPAYSVLDIASAEALLGRSLPNWKESLRRHLES